MATPVKIGPLAFEGFPRGVELASVIVTSAMGQQELLMKAVEFIRLEHELQRVAQLQEVAKMIGAHWRDKHAVNEGLMDLLAEMCRHG